MNRIFLVATFLALLACLWVAVVRSEEEKKPEVSPHAEAIQLVMTTQKETIRKVDREVWWHDVKERQWRAKRPFAPGTIDSTHLFVVSYDIDGKSVYSWFVDTSKKTVQEQEILEKIKKK